MTGTRRRPRGHEQVTVTLNGDSPVLAIPAAAAPEPAHAATEVLDPIPGPAWMGEPEGDPFAERRVIDAILDTMPPEWDGDEDRALTALRYVRHLEHEVDRLGGDPRPPWAQEAAEVPASIGDAAVGDLDAAWLFDSSLPVPPRTVPEPAEDTKPVPEAARPPAAEEAGPGAVQASPEASGTVSTEDGEPDEPVAEADCGEGSES